MNSRPAAGIGMLVVLATAWATAMQRPAIRPRIDAYVAAHQRAIVSELVNLLAIPNVGSDTDNIQRNAAQLQGMLRKRGFSTEILETDGNPLVWGELKVPGAKRTLLIWAHYDGAPVDLRGWKQASPFTPILRSGRLEEGAKDVDLKAAKFEPNWRLYARSAAHDKAPIVALLSALDALKATGVSPTSNLRVVLDGEEESGSPSLATAIPRHREKFAADLMLVLDGPVHQSGRPTIAFGIRGVLAVELTVYGPKVGVPSGHYGNWVANPGIRLARLLASMKDDDGRVLVKGFYDGIAPLGPAERAMLDAVPDDPAGLMKLFGIAAPERPDLTLQEALQLPSLNIRGLSSAFVGSEARAIIPDRAVATIDVRLVTETPRRDMAEKIRAHILAQGFHIVESEPDDQTRARYPRIVKLVLRGASGNDAYRISPLAPESTLVAEAVGEMLGERPVLIRTMGASFPIVPFIQVMGFPAITLPTVNFDDNEHAENENLRLGHFFTGIVTIAAVLTM